MKLIPKVVGGYTRACLDRAMAVYSKAIDTLVPVSSCRVAEATKLLENIFRSVNIALVNELKVVYGGMGIDIWEVIEAAKTKPFGFMPFYRGPWPWRALCPDRSVLSHMGKLANTVNIRVSSSWPARSIRGCPSTSCTRSRMHSTPNVNLSTARRF